MTYDQLTSELIKNLQSQHPYDTSMDRDKYNEWIMDLLYEDITSKLWQSVNDIMTMTIWHMTNVLWHNDIQRNTYTTKTITKQIIYFYTLQIRHKMDNINVTNK